MKLFAPNINLTYNIFLFICRCFQKHPFSSLFIIPIISTLFKVHLFFTHNSISTDHRKQNAEMSRSNAAVISI